MAVLIFGSWQASPAATRGAETSLEQALRDVLAATPRQASDFRAAQTQRLQRAARQMRVAAGDLVFDPGRTGATTWLQTTEHLLAAKDHADRALNRMLALRRDFVSIDDDAPRREAIRNFLHSATTLIDLSGRLRYLLRDAIGRTAQHCARDRTKRLELIDLLIEYESGIGAGVMAALLEDPPASSQEKPADDLVKAKVLVLIATTQESDLLPQVAALARDEAASPRLVVMAAECVRRLGLPQDPHPRQDDSLPQPAITAKQLYDRLAMIDAEQLPARKASERTRLLDWLRARIAHGVTEDSYRFFGHEVREGDWLLMRNPSPYNLFTDLSPGLFTHVGVVTTDIDETGIRRFVIVDLPERGERIPVTNVDAYLLDTLHYVFLRHPEEQVAKRMGRAARAMMGNAAQFDLNFDTSRVRQYAEGDLQERKIHTYCAGFLLICAERSGAPREDFFPLVEYPAPGNTQANLRTLGLSIGKDFVSPTAALFSPKLEIAGRRRPMYDPGREVQQAVYDHFARQMAAASIRPSPDARQALREKLARLSENNRWLRQALAKASGVSAEMDLVAAAKAAAVVETLDEVAQASKRQYLRVQQAFHAGSRKRLAEAGVSDERIEQIERLRGRHRRLHQVWAAGRLRPHELQRRLVAFYAQQGREHLDRRFFPSQRGAGP